MSRVPGDLILKDPQSVEPFTFNWTTYLAELGESVVIDTSTFTVTALNGESPVTLEVASDAILSGNLKTQFYLSGGTLYARYKVTNHIVTDTTPAVEDDRTVTFLIAHK